MISLLVTALQIQFRSSSSASALLTNENTLHCIVWEGNRYDSKRHVSLVFIFNLVHLLCKLKGCRMASWTVGVQGKDIGANNPYKHMKYMYSTSTKDTSHHSDRIQWNLKRRIHREMTRKPRLRKWKEIEITYCSFERYCRQKTIMTSMQVCYYGNCYSRGYGTFSVFKVGKYRLI